MTHTELIAHSDRLCQLVRAEMVLTAAAYGLPCPAAATACPEAPLSSVEGPVEWVAPLETPPVSFVRARAEAEVRAGVRLVKFFAPALGTR